MYSTLLVPSTSHGLPNLHREALRHCIDVARSKKRFVMKKGFSEKTNIISVLMSGEGEQGKVKLKR